MDNRQAALDFTKALGAYSTHADLMMARNKTADPRVQAQLAPLEHRAFAREFAQESPLKAAVSLPFAIPAYTAAKALGLQNARSPASWAEMQQGFTGLGEGLGNVGKNWLSQLQAFGKNTGEYWADNNQTFEKTNPGVGQRVLRSINPVTGLGSALGSMHTAAGNGDPAGMALATAEAVPLFGALKTVATAGKGFTKSSSRQAADWKKFTALLGMSAGTSLASDDYANQQEKK